MGSGALSSPGPLVVGPLTLDRRGYQVHVGARPVRLSPTQFNLLYHFMRNPGQVFSPRELLTRVWGYVPATADLALVRWHIKQLREKIEEDAAHPWYIRTVPRHGFTLAVVEPQHDSSS